MRKVANNVLLDVFTTAIEGGLDYWSVTEKYYWVLPGTEATPDLDGFYAEISSDTCDWPGKLRIDADVIYRGIVALASNATSANPQTCLICKRVLDNIEDAVCDVDADVADAIVQVGLFGAIVFG